MAKEKYKEKKENLSITYRILRKIELFARPVTKNQISKRAECIGVSEKEIQIIRHGTVIKYIPVLEKEKLITIISRKRKNAPLYYLSSKGLDFLLKHDFDLQTGWINKRLSKQLSDAWAKYNGIKYGFEDDIINIIKKAEQYSCSWNECKYNKDNMFLLTNPAWLSYFQSYSMFINSILKDLTESNTKKKSKDILKQHLIKWGKINNMVREDLMSLNDSIIKTLDAL